MCKAYEKFKSPNLQDLYAGKYINGAKGVKWGPLSESWKV